MAITAADVSKLRTMTGAGMMDCKKALEESTGDFEKAIEIIRKKGQSVANKRADRDATEGVVLSKVSVDGKLGVTLVLNCETDFVAKNEDFVKFAQSILNLAVEKKAANLDELKKLPFNGGTVAEKVIQQIGVIGEKLDLAYFENLEAVQVIAYIHPGNKLATMVGFNKAVSDIQVGKDIAMQVAAMNPIAVDKENISQTVVDKEIEIGKEQAKNEGKPENMLEKIALGKLAKFYKENTLLNQDFIKDAKISVKEYLKSKDKDLTVTGFNRFSLNN